MKFMDNYKSKFKKEYSLIKESDDDDESPSKEKATKDKKIFKVGDTIKCLDPKGKKLPPECVEFLITFTKFTVLQVSEKLNIDIGMVRNNEPYFFGPNRFELVNGTAPIRKGNEEESSSSQSSAFDKYMKLKKEKEEALRKEKEEEWNKIKEEKEKKARPFWRKKPEEDTSVKKDKPYEYKPIHYYTDSGDIEWGEERGEKYGKETVYKDDDTDWAKRWKLMSDKAEKELKDQETGNKDDDAEWLKNWKLMQKEAEEEREEREKKWKLMSDEAEKEGKKQMTEEDLKKIKEDIFKQKGSHYYGDYYDDIYYR